MTESVEHDERPFAEWRDQTVAHFLEMAARNDARAACSTPPSRLLRRRAQALRKLARILEEER